MGVIERALQAPVTSLCLIVLAMLFAATVGSSDGSPQDIRAQQRKWGVAQALQWVRSDPENREIWLPDLSGPFDIWDGDWWRIPVSTLHHAGFLHLFLNSLFLATFGFVLEREWGSLRMLFFILGAALVCPLPEFLLGQYPIGFSGVACGVFGVLWGLRSSRPTVAAIITPEQICAVLGYLVLCVILTELDQVQIANLSHFTGIGYGYLAGRIAGGTWPYRRLGQAAFVAAHALLILPYWYVVHPEWNGRYHWYLATISPDGQPRRELDTAKLEQAVAVSPELAGVWELLAENHLRHGRQLEAWNALLHGLAAEPTRAELWDNTRPLWRRLAATPEREAAISILHKTFGDSSELYLEQIRRIEPRPILIAPEHPTPVALAPVGRQPPTWTPPTDPAWWRSPATGRRKDVPPEEQQAVEGVTL